MDGFHNEAYQLFKSGKRSINWYKLSLALRQFMHQRCVAYVPVADDPKIPHRCNNMAAAKEEVCVFHGGGKLSRFIPPAALVEMTDAIWDYTQGDLLHV